MTISITLIFSQTSAYTERPDTESVFGTHFSLVLIASTRATDRVELTGCLVTYRNTQTDADVEQLHCL